MSYYLNIAYLPKEKIHILKYFSRKLNVNLLKLLVHCLQTWTRLKQKSIFLLFQEEMIITMNMTSRVLQGLSEDKGLFMYMNNHNYLAVQQ